MVKGLLCWRKSHDLLIVVSSSNTFISNSSTLGFPIAHKVVIVVLVGNVVIVDIGGMGESKRINLLDDAVRQ